MKMLTICLLLLLAAGAQAQDVFTVDGRNNCGGPEAGVTRVLAAGDHHFTMSGAMSNWGTNAENGGLSWLAWIRVHDSVSGTTTNYGAGTGRRATSAQAAADVAGTVFEFTLAAEATVSFFFTDTPCSDNRGSITVTLDDPFVVATQASSWGVIKATYR